MTPTNITQAARILGINKSTLVVALKSFPATPVGMKGFRSSPVPVYDVDQIRECYARYKAQVEANRHRARPSLEEKNAKYNPCTRCGRPDKGNDVRDGLCFDCYCHDHGKPFDKTGFVSIWDAVSANARGMRGKRCKRKGGTMSDNEKTANEIIGELEAENARLQAGIDRMSNILAGQSELDAKGDAAQNMRLRAENERLKMLLSMWWRNAFDKDFWMPKCAVEQTIKAIANNNKEDNK